MSAFIVSTDTIDLIISALQRVQGPELSSIPGLQHAGQILLDENYRSVNARYNEAEKAPAYCFEPVDLDSIPEWRAVALKSLRCWQYQACETDNFKETTAYHLGVSLMGLLGVSDKSTAYQAAPWGWERSSVTPEPEPPKAEKKYTTCAEDAATVRAALKAKGWNSRDISVRADNYSMGSSLHVTIKNPTVPLKVVEAISNQAESIDRDQWGEILSGGNRFVHVGYAHDTLKLIGEAWLGAIDAAFLELAAADSNVLIPIAGTNGLLLGRDNHGRGLAIWGNHSHLMNCYDISAAAEFVGVQMLNHKADTVAA